MTAASFGCRMPIRAETQLRQGRTVEIQRIALRQILWRHIAEVSTDESLGYDGLWAIQTGSKLGGETIDDLRLAFLGTCGHSPPRIN